MEWNLAQLLLFVGIYLPIIIFVISFPLFLFGIGEVKSRYNTDAPLGGVAAIAIVWLIFGALIVGLPYMILNVSAKSEIAQMEAFYDQNVEVHRDAILETEDVTIINAVPGIFFDAAYQGLGVTVGEAIADFRNEITNYNNQIAFYNAWQDTFVGGGYMQSLPDHLKPLRLELVGE